MEFNSSHISNTSPCLYLSIKQSYQTGCNSYQVLPLMEARQPFPHLRPCTNGHKYHSKSITLIFILYLFSIYLSQCTHSLFLSRYYSFFQYLYSVSLLNMPIINPSAIYPSADPEFASFASRRSVVHSTEGIVACTQPLAAKCGLQILQKGGNAAVCHLSEPLTLYN